jgi:lipooligosaccharide transport system permease protein
MSVMGVSYRSYRVWQRNRDVVFRLWFTELAPPLLGPLMVIAALGLGLGAFVKLDNGERYIEFLTPGILALFPMLWAMFECGWGSFGRMTMQGVYDAVVATPLNVEDVVAGEILWGASRGTFQATHIIIAALFFTPAYHLIDSPLVVFVIPFSLLYGVLFASMAMCYTSIAPSMSSYNFLWAFVINPMFWFGGAFYPLGGMPRGLEILAQFLPLTHVVDVNRALVEGDFGWMVLVHLAIVAGTAAFFFALAIWSMRRRLVK